MRDRVYSRGEWGLTQGAREDTWDVPGQIRCAGCSRVVVSHCTQMGGTQYARVQSLAHRSDRKGLTHIHKAKVIRWL